MSSTDQSENNQGLPFADDAADSTRIPDPKHYYHDGSVVFQVENVLFKVHASLILRPDPVSPGPGNSDQRYPTGVENLPRKLTDSSDDRPIILPNVRTRHFRNFLFAVVGLPSDPEYLALLTSAHDTKKHSRDLLVRYLDISRLACQFGMFGLEQWARSQLRLVLKSMYDLASSEWDADTLLELDSYARSAHDDDLTSSVTIFLQYFVSISADKQDASQHPLPLNLDACVRLYRNPSLPDDNPALFGCLFVCILSLGRQSPTWTMQLTQKERLVLYTAQVGLTSISRELESAKWLQSSADSLSFMTEMCSGCQLQLGTLWKETFGKCEGLTSEVTLQDVTALAHLPQYRKVLASRWITPSNCSTSGARFGLGQSGIIPSISSISNIGYSHIKRFTGGTTPEPTLPTVNEPECPKLKHPLGDIDRRMQLVYQVLACRHKGFSSEV